MAVTANRRMLRLKQKEKHKYRGIWGTRTEEGEGVYTSQMSCHVVSLLVRRISTSLAEVVKAWMAKF